MARRTRRLTVTLGRPRRAPKPEPTPIIRQDRIELPLLDLTAISRPGLPTTILLDDGNLNMAPWIKVRETSISQYTGGRREGAWRLSAYWNGGVTDGEHDLAYILCLDLAGVALDSVHYGTIRIDAWIAGGSDDFRVPPPDYEQLIRNHPETTLCKECRKRDKTEPHHLMVPQGFYMPPKQPELFAQLVGRRIEIRMGLVDGDE